MAFGDLNVIRNNRLTLSCQSYFLPVGKDGGFPPAAVIWGFIKNTHVQLGKRQWMKWGVGRDTCAATLHWLPWPHPTRTAGSLHCCKPAPESRGLGEQLTPGLRSIGNMMIRVPAREDVCSANATQKPDGLTLCGPVTEPEAGG